MKSEHAAMTSFNACCPLLISRAVRTTSAPALAKARQGQFDIQALLLNRSRSPVCRIARECLKLSNRCLFAADAGACETFFCPSGCSRCTAQESPIRVSQSRSLAGAKARQLLPASPDAAAASFRWPRRDITQLRRQNGDELGVTILC